MDTLLRFTSPTCHPCKTMARLLDDMNLGIPIEVIDITVYPEKIDEYNLRGVPTLFYKGKSLVGMASEEQIKNFVGVV